MGNADTSPNADHRGQARILTKTRMAQILSFENTREAWRDPSEWVETETHGSIVAQLDRIRSVDGAAMTMIAGAPGIGKTLAARGYCLDLAVDIHRFGHFISVVKGEGTVRVLVAQMMRSLNLSLANNMGLDDARELIAKRIGRKSVIVVDESQYLDQKDRKTGVRGAGFEWMRGLAETAECGLAFCGDLTLIGLIGAYPQLESRVRMHGSLILKSVPDADVAAMASETGFEDPACFGVLRAVAALAGGLRNVESVLTTGAAFAGTDRRTAEHLRAAVEFLKLTSKGGR